MEKNDLSVLVLSCDKYSDLWKPFFECFFKYWKDIDYPVYLGSNNKVFDDNRVKTILSGNDLDWSTSLYKILEQVESEYVFLFLEDFFLVDNVDNVRFKDIFNRLAKDKFNHCQIESLFDIKNKNDDGVYIIEKGMPYRVHVFGIWKKDYLKKILISGENPWNFEIMASYRSSYSDGFYCLPKNTIKTINMVEKGKWFPKNIKFIKDLGINIDDKSRHSLDGMYLLKSKIQVMIVKIIILIPWKIRLKIMNTLRKIFFSY